MSDRVDKALKARKSRMTSSGSSKTSVDDALEERKKRLSSESESNASDLNSRYMTVVSDYNDYMSNQDPTWGKPVSDTLNSQRDKVLSLSKLISDIEAGGSYLDKDTSRTMLDNLSKMKEGYKNRASNAQYYSQFDSKESYDKYVSDRKDYEESLTYDTDAGQKELDDLIKLRDGVNASSSQATYNDYYTGYIRAGYGKNKASELAQKAVDANNDSVARYLEGSGYSSMEELNDDIAKKTTKINTAKRLQKNQKLNDDAVNAEDFDYYSSKGAAIVNPTQREAEGWLVIGGDFFGSDGIHVGGKEVGNIVTYSRENADSIALGGGGMVGDSKYAQMTDEEVSIYNYYLAKENEGKVEIGTAQDYLDSIEDVLNQREASGYFNGLENNVPLELAFGFSAGIDQFRSGVSSLFNTEDDYIAPSSIQYASGMVREDLADVGGQFLGSSIGQGAYDLITTTSNMLPSILASTVVGALNPVAGEIVGAGLMGASAAGNAYQEMLNLGYDKDQARTYSLLTGASEAGLQYLLGGITKLGGKLTSNIASKTFEKIASGINNAAGQFAIKYGGEFVANMASEGTEEFLQDVLDPFFKSIATGEELGDIDWEQAAYSGFLGALSAGFLEGTSSIGTNISNMNNARNIKKDGTLNDTVALAKTYSADSIAYKIADKVTNNTSTTQIAMMLHDMDARMSEQNVSDIKWQLMRNGVAEKNAESISKWLAKVCDGAKLTKAQQMAIDENPVIGRVMRKFLDSNTTVNQRFRAGINYAEIYSRQSAKNLSKNTEAKFAMGQAIKDSEASEARIKYGIGVSKSTNDFLDSQVADAIDKVQKAKLGVSKETVSERTSDTPSDGARIKKVNSIKNGTMKLELEDGTVVDSDEVEYRSEDEALIYESVLSLGYDSETANAIIQGFNYSEGLTAGQYMLGIQEGIDYGSINYPQKSISDNGFYSALSGSQKNFAYKLGTNIAGTRTESAQATVESKNAIDEKKKGRVHLPTSFSSLTDRQKVSVSTVGRLVSDIAHNEVYFFESVKKDGKRVFKEDISVHKAGESAPNGFYDPNTGAIYIDINSGNNGEGAILWTASHELTHFIRQWSPAKFKILADFLMEQYGNAGVNIDTLIKRQQDIAKKRGENMSFDSAYEEVVADAMSCMLSDENSFEKMEKLKAKDRSTWQKIKDFFTDLYNRIQEVYKELNPQTPEAQLVKDMSNKVKKTMSNLFSEALVEAGDNFIPNGVYVSGVSMDMTVNDAMSGTDIFDITVTPKQKLQERTEYEKNPKEMITIASKGAKRESMNITIDGNSFVGEASVRELRNARFRENKFKNSYIKKVNEFIDKAKEFMENARIKYQYVGLEDIYNAKIIIAPTTGEIVVSGLVNNGDYEINFDFTKTCKKRMALQEVIEKLAVEKGKLNSDGTQTEVNLSEENIRHINEVLASYGIETSCLCCFVDSKRYAMQTHYQVKVCDVWNRLIDEVNSEEGITTEVPYFNFANYDVETSKIPDEEYDKLYSEILKWRKSDHAEEGEGAVEREMKAFLKNTPSARKKLRLSDFVTESGRTNLHKLYPEIESLAKAKIGTAIPKAVEAFAPYNGEIELLKLSGNKDLATYVKSIAGARSQSFSDYIMSHIFDVIQKTASLCARKLTAHTYTKEISRARLFGMTGEKTNMSVIHEIDRKVDSWSAGLKNDGSYFVSDYEAFRKGECHQIQSIPDTESIAIQNDSRYSRDCGRICVGFSYFHMLKLHNDPDMRQVIGYHSSQQPSILKPLTNLDKSTDYTYVQNTLYFKGFKVPNYDIPNGVPSYATPPQDIETRFKTTKTGKQSTQRMPKYSKSDLTFDIKGTYEKLYMEMDGTKAAKETLRLLLEFADNNGLFIETSKAEKSHGDFDLYGDTEKTQNPYLTVDHYIEYCISQGMIPMFYEFSLNPNYYKDVYDFNVFDRLSYNPETGLHEDSNDRTAYAPQVPVHMLNSDETPSFPEDFWELADKYMKDYNYQREDFANKFPSIMQEVRAIKDNSGNPMVSYDTPTSSKGMKKSDRNNSDSFDENTGESVKYSVREEEPPKKTIKVYKLMRYNYEEKKLYPLYIDRGAEVELGTWYNADSPSFEMLKDLDIGYHLIDFTTGEVIKTQDKLPSKTQVDDATTKGIRWMSVKEAKNETSASKASKQYGGIPRLYYNVGINGSEGVSEYALRPGWHAGSLPVMYQIGNTKMRNVRDDNFVWVEGRIAFDIDYQEEAESNPSGENDIPFHIPKDGAYIKGTSNFVTKGMTWYISGAFVADRLISDREARSIVDNFNENVKDKDAPMIGYDYAREGGRVFDGEKLIEGNEFEKRDWENTKNATKMKTRRHDEGMPLKFSDRDSEGNTLSKGQQEYFMDSKIRDEDGNLLVVYHGTDSLFTVFDMTKVRSHADIQGMFFSPWEIDAGGYGSNLKSYYLNITNPASEKEAYKALKLFQGQNNFGVKAREYLIELGYDGVNNYGEEYIAFYPEQIKLIDNKTPTTNPDIRYSYRGKYSSMTDEEKAKYNEALAMYDEKYSPEEIYKNTGWWKQSDGKWRSEISNDDMELSDAFKKMFKYGNSLFTDSRKLKISMKLGEAVSMPELYMAYPELTDINIVVKSMPRIKGFGWYDAKKKEIVLRKGQPIEEAKDTIIHEIQHIIQDKEFFAYDWHMDYAERRGEIEAEDAASRLTMTPEERLNTMPVMFSDRVLMGSLFSGGGTLEAGLTYQMLDKEFAVEYNKQIATVYTDNHGREHMFVGDIRDFNSKDKKNVFYLHASPVCTNYSNASHKGGEKTVDIVTAEATARVLEEQMPNVFTVENVSRYVGSEAYNIITSKLDELGYTWDVDVYDASDYGNATKRKRMIIRAIKDGNIPSKPKKVTEKTSWGDATRAIWDTELIPSHLVRSKIEAIKNTPELKNINLTKLEKPLMIYDTTKSKKVTFAWADELSPTLTTKCGDARIIMPDGKVYEPTPLFMGRIQGLPDDYKYPKSKTVAFRIIGNGIPTQLTKSVMGGLLESAYEQSNKGNVLYSDRNTASLRNNDSTDNRTLLSNPHYDSYQARVNSINEEIRILQDKIKMYENSEEYKKYFDAIFNSDDSDKAIEDFSKWQLSSGYKKSYDKIKELQKKLSKLISEYGKQKNNKLVSDEIEDINKSGLSEGDYFSKKSVKEFGYTPYYYDAGYILKNGKMLNFSGEKNKHFGIRGEDHRCIGIIFSTSQGTDALVRFMSYGNIRIMDETPGIDIITSVEPTREQYALIKKYIRDSYSRGNFNVDFTNSDGKNAGNLNYEGNLNADRIVNDIKAFFETGELRTQSTVDMFRYSERNPDAVDNRTLLSNALATTVQNDIERSKIEEYQSKIEQMNEEQRKLAEVRSEIKQLSFATGKRDKDKIRKLQDKATKLANRINTYDKQLLRLEASKPLMAVLERERSVAKKKAKAEAQERFDAYREQAEKKQRELIDNHKKSRIKASERRRTTEIRNKIKKVVKELNDLLQTNTKDRHVPIGMQRAVAEVLEILNMDTVNAEEKFNGYTDENGVYHKGLNQLIEEAKDPDIRESLIEKASRIQKSDYRMQEKLSKLKAAYDELRNNHDSGFQFDENVSLKIEIVSEIIKDTPLNKLGEYQLEEVYELYKMILKTVRDANKAFKAGKNKTITELGVNVESEVVSVGGNNEKFAKVLSLLRRFGWYNLKPVQAMKVIGSKTLSMLFDNVRAGEDTWAVDVSEAREFFLTTSKDCNYDKWDFDKKYEFQSRTGKKFKLNLQQMLSLYAYSKREQADRHLSMGGFVFDDATEVVEKKKGIPIKYEVNTSDAYSVSWDTLTKVFNTLTIEQKVFADKMQDYLSTVMGEKGNEISRAMYDIDLFKEKAYFPLRSAKQFMYEQNDVVGEVKLKNSGFSKSTTPNANNPIILKGFMDVWSEHCNDMAMYHSFVLPLEDFNRVFNYKSKVEEGVDTSSVKQAIQNAYGRQANDYIKQMLTDINGGARSSSGTEITNKLISLFKKGAVFASASVVIQQPSAIARAMAYIDGKYFVEAVPSSWNMKNHNRDWDEVKKYAPVAVIKEMGYFDTNMGRQTVDWIQATEYSGLKEKAKAIFTDSDYRDELLSKAPALADEIAWVHIWNAVKRETAGTTKVTDADILEKCGKRFTEVVVNTQVYDSVLSRSHFMRSKDTGVKMATAFMAEPTTSMNMLIDAFIQGKRRGKEGKIYGARTIGSVTAAMILNSILVSIVYAARDDDKDKTYIEKYLGSLTGSLTDSINPLSLIPYVKDIISITQGWDVERSDMALVSALWDSYNALFKDTVSPYRKVEGFAGAIGNIFGLPVKNIMRDARGMYNVVNSFMSENKTRGQFIKESVMKNIPIIGSETSKTDSLYNAIIGGDSETIRRAKAKYSDPTKLETAIRTGLRENDDRIQKAAEARYSGNLTEYKRIVLEIKGEGNFSQDTIVATINTAINKLNDDKDSDSSESRKQGLFKQSDIRSAIEGDDTSVISDIKSDLISTYVANGKTNAEAEKAATNSIRDVVKDSVKEGNITDAKAKGILTTYCGMTGDDASMKINYWNFTSDNPTVDISESAVAKYYNDIKPYGISVRVYIDYYERQKNAVGVDADGDGKTDSGSKKNSILAIIDSLPIDSDQKDVLYRSNGWAESELYKAPWH